MKRELGIITIPGEQLAWEYCGWDPFFGPILESIPYPWPTIASQ